MIGMKSADQPLVAGQRSATLLVDTNGNKKNGLPRDALHGDVEKDSIKVCIGIDTALFEVFIVGGQTIDFLRDLQ